MEHVFNVLEISWIWHVENVPHEFFHNLGGISENSFEPSQASLVFVMKVAGRSQRFCRSGVVGLCGRLGRFPI